LQNARQIYPKGQADPNNQCPDKWSSTVPEILILNEVLSSPPKERGRDDIPQERRHQ